MNVRGNGADYLEDALPHILEILQSSDVREIDVTEGDVRIRLHRAEPLGEGELPLIGLPTAAGSAIEPQPVTVEASLVGTFYLAEHPGSAPYVSEGSRVEDDTVVGIIEALNVLTEVEAGCTGVISRVLATDGQPVEYGQPLFQVLPSG